MRELKSHRFGGLTVLADYDVYLEVFHSRVKNLFHCPRQSVYLIDEKHISRLEIIEYGSQLTGLFYRRAAGDLDAHAHFICDYPCQGGLAQSRRAEEKRMVKRLPSLKGSLYIDGKIAL